MSQLKHSERGFHESSYRLSGDRQRAMPWSCSVLRTVGQGLDLRFPGSQEVALLWTPLTQSFVCLSTALLLLCPL